MSGTVESFASAHNVSGGQFNVVNKSISISAVSLQMNAILEMKSNPNLRDPDSNFANSQL